MTFLFMRKRIYKEGPHCFTQTPTIKIYIFLFSMVHWLLEARQKRKPSQASSREGEDESQLMNLHLHAVYAEFHKQQNSLFSPYCQVTLRDMYNGLFEEGEDTQNAPRKCPYRYPENLKRCKRSSSDLYPFSCDLHTENFFPFLEIKKSNIEGADYGLFARKDIAPGTVIGYYYAKFMQIVQTEVDKAKMGDYTLSVDQSEGKNMVLLIHPQPRSTNDTIVRMANGNVYGVNDFNAFFSKEMYKVSENVTVEIVSAKTKAAILKGEEIIMQYGDKYE